MGCSDTWMLADSSTSRPKCAIREELWMSSERQHLVSVLTYVGKKWCKAQLAATLSQRRHQSWQLLPGYFRPCIRDHIYRKSVLSSSWKQIIWPDHADSPVRLLPCPAMLWERFHGCCNAFVNIKDNAPCSEHHESKSTVSMPGH